MKARGVAELVGLRVAIVAIFAVCSKGQTLYQTSTFAGTCDSSATPYPTTDGPRLSATFGRPQGLLYDASGPYLYVAGKALQQITYLHVRMSKYWMHSVFIINVQVHYISHYFTTYYCVNCQIASRETFNHFV